MLVEVGVPSLDSPHDGQGVVMAVVSVSIDGARRPYRHENTVVITWEELDAVETLLDDNYIDSDPSSPYVHGFQVATERFNEHLRRWFTKEQG